MRAGQVQGTGLGLMGPKKIYKNVHTGSRQGKEPEPIVVLVQFPVPILVPRSVIKP